jgi:hypothetical protein
VVEGYCDFVAQDGSFPEAEGLALLAAGKDDSSSSFRYFKYRQSVRYLMQNRQLSFQQLVDSANDLDRVESE